MHIIISPAKKQDFNHPFDVANASTPLFQKKATALVKTLKNYTTKQLSERLHISQSLAELNYERFQNFESIPSTNTLQSPAIFAYQGDTYQGLQAKTFSQKELIYAQDHLHILSGLYGILRPLDLIQPYRLEMGTKNIGDPDLYSYWKEEALKYFQHQNISQLINLASDEYSKLITKASKNTMKIVNITFLQDKEGVLKNIGLFAKKARGQLASFILKNQLSQTKDITTFNQDGYAYQPELSNDSSLVFVREAN